MYFSKSAAILAFVPSVVQGQTNMVTLGSGGNLAFNPNTMTVNQGDNVTFAFMSATHSVASTSLSQPNVADNNVYSGLIPVDNTTPTPPGTNLPKNNRLMRIRATSGLDLAARGLLSKLGGGNAGANANNGNANANANGANANANTGNANTGNANTGNANTGTANTGTNGVATFTVQMNTVGMQAMICDQAQHAANGMIMMINVLPQGQQKRQNSDAALQQALTNYLAVGQQTKTTPATTSPGTGGQLNAVAQNLGPTNVNTNTGKKAKKAGKAAKAAGGAAAAANPLAALAGGN